MHWKRFGKELILWAGIACFAFTLLGDEIFRQMVPRTIRIILFDVRLGIVLLLPVFMAIYRGYVTNPLLRKRYGEFLSLLPWDITKPLPGGSVHITVGDIFFILLLSLCGFLSIPVLVFYPPIMFLTVYLGCMIASIYGKETRAVYIILYLIPLSLLLVPDWIYVLGMLVAIYLFCRMALRRALSNFPWNSRLWHYRASEEDIKNAFLTNTIIWPHLPMNEHKPAFSINTRQSLNLAALAAWWGFVLMHAFNWPTEVFFPVYLYFLFTACFWRVSIYISRYSSPVNLFGRLFRFKFIIPGYDYVFIAPLLTLLIGGACVRIIPCIDIPEDVGYSAAIGLVLFLVTWLPPSLQTWELTGQHSIRVPRRREIYANLDPVSLKIKQLLMAVSAGQRPPQ